MANPLMGMMQSPATNPAQGLDPNALRQVAQSAKRMMNMLQGVKDPQQALMMAAQQNPQLKAVMQMCKGRNPQDVFYEECKKHGVDPNVVLNALKG